MSIRSSFMAAVAIATITAGSSFAQICTTHSKNITFVSPPSEVDAATTSVLSACQQNPVTVNADCSNNLRCGFNDIQNPYPSGQAACYNSSHGIGFQAFGDPLNLNAITQTVLTACTQTTVTINTECSASVVCADRYQASLPYPSGQVVCTTTSKGIRFEQRGPDSAAKDVANATATQCTQNPVTINTECSQNMSCHDSQSGIPDNHHGDQVVCRTNSHNIPFEVRGPRDQIDQLTQQVLNQCTQNPVTINTECSQNLHCN